jgi:Protein of unknown function, DUF547
MVRRERAMRWIVLGLVVTLAACSGVPTSFKPTNPLLPGEFSHRLFDDVLAEHVTNGVIDYPGIQRDDRLPIYLAQLDRTDPNAFATRQERLAFWINAYNAFAIKGILDDDSPMTYLGRYRYFIGKDYRVGGETINLYDLERQVLIKQFHEPLIHFAIVCASTSCPKLQPWTYEPNQLNVQLDRVARAFINDPMKNRFDRTRKVASLSMIFKWFDEDFTGAAGSVLTYIAAYVSDPELARDLLRSHYRIDYLEYDWSLNGVPPKEMSHAGQS